MGIGDMLQAQQDAEDAAKYRALQKPEKIDQLALELSMMGVKVPPRDTAFFQAAVGKWLSS
jgi:hypothetical protein